MKCLENFQILFVVIFTQSSRQKYWCRFPSAETSQPHHSTDFFYKVLFFVFELQVKNEKKHCPQKVKTNLHFGNFLFEKKSLNVRDFQHEIISRG